MILNEILGMLKKHKKKIMILFIVFFTINLFQYVGYTINAVRADEGLNIIKKASYIITAFARGLFHGAGESIKLTIGTVICVVIAIMVAKRLSTSAFMENTVRFVSGSRKIERPDEICRLEPLFREVLDKAKIMEPEISDDILLYQFHSDRAEMYAIGKNSICISDTAMGLPDEKIKAMFAHEFGHIVRKDSNKILLAASAGIVSIGVVFAMKQIKSLIARDMGGTEGAIVDKGGDFLLDGLLWLTLTVCTILFLGKDKSNDFFADEFAFALGYGEPLCEVIETFEKTKQKTIFAQMNNCHPDKDLRIKKLQEKGCRYQYQYS